MRKGVNDITLASSSDLQEVTTAVAASIREAMLAHQREVESLMKSGIRWYGLEVAPMVVSATLSILGAFTRSTQLATGGALLRIFGYAES
jgi:hypothetical protein